MNVYFNKALVKASAKTVFNLSESFNFCVASHNRGEGKPEVVNLKEFSVERLVVEFGYSILGIYSTKAEAQEAFENFKEDYLIWVVVTNVTSGYVDYYSDYSYEESYCSDPFCTVQVFYTEDEAEEEYQSIIDYFHRWLLAYNPVSGEAWITELCEGTIQHAIGPYANLYGEYESQEEAEKALNELISA